jgi:hypothetical protein
VFKNFVFCAGKKLKTYFNYLKDVNPYFSTTPHPFINKFVNEKIIAYFYTFYN